MLNDDDDVLFVVMILFILENYMKYYNSFFAFLSATFGQYNA